MLILLTFIDVERHSAWLEMGGVKGVKHFPRHPSFPFKSATLFYPSLMLCSAEKEILLMWHIQHTTEQWAALWCSQRVLSPVSSPAGEERGLLDDLQDEEVEVLKQMFFGVILCALATLAAKGDMMFTSVFIGAVAAMVGYWLSDKTDRLLGSFLKGRWSEQEDKEDQDREHEWFISLAWIFLCVNIKYTYLMFYHSEQFQWEKRHLVLHFIWNRT